VHRSKQYRIVNGRTHLSLDHGPYRIRHLQYQLWRWHTSTSPRFAVMLLGIAQIVSLAAICRRQASLPLLRARSIIDCRSLVWEWLTVLVFAVCRPSVPSSTIPASERSPHRAECHGARRPSPKAVLLPKDPRVACFATSVEMQVHQHDRRRMRLRLLREVATGTRSNGTAYLYRSPRL
jgi:hypothetical protein